MTEEIKKALQQSVKVLKLNGGLANQETKSVIISMEKLINKRRPSVRPKRA